ncbi:MAG: redoxin domain-containing protein [Pseudomonadota bacterium]
MTKAALICLAATLAIAVPSAAHEHGGAKAEAEAPVMIGPKVGDAAPSLEGTVAVMADGAEATTGENGRVLVFVRSADWCPFCKTQLNELEDITGSLAEAGWTIEAISYDSPEILAGFANENDLSFTLRSDEGSEAIRAFGLLNTDVREGARSYGIPHPAVVFVSSAGTVSAVLREEGYRTRPSVDAIMETAEALGQLG